MLQQPKDTTALNENQENGTENSYPLVSRRKMLELSSLAGLAALTGLSTSATAQTAQQRPRIAVVCTYWAATRSHADWIVTKLLDGYWWQGAHTPSRIEVVSVYIHQLEQSGLGQKVCKSKGIPIFKTVGEAVTLGGKELAVEGVVIIGEHGNYPTNLKGQWLLPRWWFYQQVMKVFEQSKRSVPVFNDKHFSYNWDEAKWMFDKSRELNFPLTGGSCVPTYYRTPEIELEIDAPLKTSIVVGSAPDEGAFFHCVDVLQSFVERRKGGESGVKAIQYIKGPETWRWVDNNSWASTLLESVRKKFDLKPQHFKENRRPNVCVIEYNDGTKAAIIAGEGVGWTFAGQVEGRKEPMIVSMLDFPGPFAQYHADNGQPHWITEMMVTKKEPFNAERLLLSTGIVSNAMDSNWENGRYLEVGRRIETHFLNMTYHPTRPSRFNTGQRPPVTPYLRGFSE